jgi:hypothetical protein
MLMVFNFLNGNNCEISKFLDLELSTSSLIVPSVHYLKIPHTFLMEYDCEDSSSTKMASSSHANIIQMLMAISSQLMSSYQGLQDQLVQTNFCLSTDFQRVGQDNDNFKQDVRAELDALRNLMTQQTSIPSNSSSAVSFTVPSFPSVSSSSSSSTAPVTLPIGASSSPHLDFQTQMMKLLNEPFVKNI